MTRFRGDFVFSLADQGLVSLVNFSSFFLLARGMDGAALGRFSIAYTLILVATAFQQSLLTGAFQVKGARKSGTALQRFLTVSMTAQLAFGVVMAVVFGVSGALLWQTGSNLTGSLIVVLGLAIGPWMMQDLIRKIFHTMGWTGRALLNDAVCYGLQIGGVLWLLAGAGAPAAWQAVAVYGASSAVAALIGLIQLRSRIKLSLLRQRQKVRVVLREIWDFGKWLGPAQLWRQVGSTGHTWVVAALMGPAALGAYRAVSHLVNVFNPIEMAITLWLPPRASRQFEQGGASALKRWFRKVAPVLLGPTALGALVLVVFAEPIVEMAYPGKYSGMGLHWILILHAVARVINFGRDLYQNSLLASDRPDTFMKDSLLTVGVKYGLGIPAVWTVGLIGAPVATLVLAIVTLSYNRRIFNTIADEHEESIRPSVWRPVGDSENARIFVDVPAGVATKIYGDDRDVDEAWRYYIGLMACFDNADSELFSTPTPIEFEPDIPLVQMEAVPGEGLGGQIRTTRFTPPVRDALAMRVWAGLKAVPAAIADPALGLWPDRILYDPDSNRLSFVDFTWTGQGATRGLDARDPDSASRMTLADFLGRALLAMSRPTRWFRIRGNLRVIRFCRAVLRQAAADGMDPGAVRAWAEEVYHEGVRGGSSERRAWYKYPGALLFRLHSGRLFQGVQPRSTEIRSALQQRATPMICHFVEGFPRNDEQTANGVHKALRSLTAGLMEVGASTEIVCQDGVRCSWTTPEGVDIHAFRGRGRLRLPQGLRDHVLSLPPRTVFVLHGQFSPSVARVAAMLRRMGRKYVMMPHTLYSDAAFAKKRWAKRIYWRLIEKPLLDRAVLIQMMEKSQAEPLRRLGVKTPVAVVPNAIDPAATPPEESLTWSSEGPIRLYYLGRINFHQKGLDLLVKALGKVRDVGPFHLTIQGPDGGDLSALRSLVKQTGTEDIVTFLPADLEADSVGLIAAHDVFCMTSRIEGFPMAALEAMQAARPMLFTDVSGLTRAVEESGCGVLVSPRTADIVRGLRKLAAARIDFEKMGKAGRAYATSRFSPSAAAQMAARAYRQAVASVAAAPTPARPARSAGHTPAPTPGTGRPPLRPQGVPPSPRKPSAPADRAAPGGPRR